MSLPIKDGGSRTFQLLRHVKAGGLTPEQLERLQHARSSAADKAAAILVVDDFQQIRQVIVQILQTLGYTNIAEADDGQVALELLLERTFDLVLLDIDMPRLNGFDVLAAMKRHAELQHVPVIVASGLDHLDAVVRCIELGATDFLPKPVNAVLLKARVAASLERKRLLDLERLRHLELLQEKHLLEIEQEKSERLLLNILGGAAATGVLGAGFFSWTLGGWRVGKSLG